MNRFRDEELGRALRALDVPEHGRGFAQAVEKALEADEGAFRHEAAERDHRSERPRPRPAGPSAAHRERHRWLWWMAPVPLAAAILLVVWIAGGFSPKTGPLQPQMATAAEVEARMVAALAGVRSLRGEMVVVSPEDVGPDHEIGAEGAVPPEAGMRWSFALTAAGDFRLSGLTRAEEVAYLAAAGTEQVLSGGTVGEQVVAAEGRGLAVGPPDPGPSNWVLSRRLGSVVRALLAESNQSVVETVYEGRPAWLLETPVQANRLSTTSGDHLAVTVDQATGFPVRIRETRQGIFMGEMRLEGLEFNTELTAADFRLAFPEGVEVGGYDAGFRRVTLDAVAGEVGYQPLVPRTLPEGFEPAEIAVAGSSQGTGKEGMNPESRGVVSMAFRRGLDLVIITSRLVGDDPSLWSDPLAGGEGFIDDPETVELTTGALAGARAELQIDPRAVPHMWILGEELVVTISGDLSKEELLVVAGSLQPRG